MGGATFFPVIPHFLADKGIWIFAPNVAARADFAPFQLFKITNQTHSLFHFSFRAICNYRLPQSHSKIEYGE